MSKITFTVVVVSAVLPPCPKYVLCFVFRLGRASIGHYAFPVIFNEKNVVKFIEKKGERREQALTV